MKTLLLLFSLTLAVLGRPALAVEFDHQHRAWTALTRDHVQWNSAGTASTVDYAGMALDRAKLRAYLAGLATIDKAEYARWSWPQRQAFLINAYNAATVEMILTGYPKIASIKELGGLFSSPWKRAFVRLLGEVRSLDNIEHTLLRGAPEFDDPRIHFAVNCASIGCPALRDEAFVAEHLSAQLRDQSERFLRGAPGMARSAVTGAILAAVVATG
jgi:hypothetical protein